MRRKMPYIVWYGDELDVRVTLTEHKLQQEADPFRQLFGGAVFQIEKQMRALDIGFDTGMGGGGRDWEWDYSLSGPISVAFRGRAKRPEKRTARPRPRLVFSNEKPRAT
jgi:hypothetical protein